MTAKSWYSKTRIRVAVCNIIYLAICLWILLSLDIWLISIIINMINKNSVGPLIIISLLACIILFIIGVIIVAIVTNGGIIIKNKLIINYYKNIKFSDIKKLKINYDSKLWLTAAKNSFHAQSFTIDNNEYKTAIVFTNSSKYYGFPKFKMPSVLLAKNYINNYAVIGYDELKREYVVIGYTNKLND